MRGPHRHTFIFEKASQMVHSVLIVPGKINGQGDKEANFSVFHLKVHRWLYSGT